MFSVLLWHTSGKPLKVVHTHQLILPLDVLESKIQGTISLFKKVQVLAVWKNFNYQIQTHPNSKQEINSVAQKRAVEQKRHENFTVILILLVFFWSCGQWFAKTRDWKVQKSAWMRHSGQHRTLQPYWEVSCSHVSFNSCLCFHKRLCIFFSLIKISLCSASF